MSAHDSAGAAAAAAAAVLGFVVLRATRGVAQRRSSTMSNATLFCWHDLSRRECVGSVIKCARQSCDKQECDSDESTCSPTRREEEKKKGRRDEEKKRRTEPLTQCPLTT